MRIGHIMIIAVLLLAFFIHNIIFLQKYPLPIAIVDLSKYQGIWYEISRLPAFFQKDCIDSVAKYTINKNKEIEVINQCMRNGILSSVKGIAIPNYSEIYPGSYIYPGSLSIKFEGSPFIGEYNILNIDTNYNTVLVGTSDRKYLWILSRKPLVNQSIYDNMIKYAKNLGFSIEKMIVN